jgi:hypothetical protein
VKAAPAYEHATDMTEKDKDVAAAKAKAMSAAKGETM